MKSSSKKKKDEAVDFKKLFKFQSFSERIANIKIDVVHRVGLTSELPEECDTFFSEALQKWRELNCTLDFVAFERQVRNKVDSLAQLVHHKDEIVRILQEHLQVKDTLAFEPLLDLVVQLARDLQSDFYPEFRTFFPILVALCCAHNADLIQNAFTTLAYLFKFLWRYMLKDIESVYGMYSELLLQSPKHHIRQFAVESFGFLLRKVRRHDSLFSMVFRSLAEEPELAEGVGQLLFEVCKGVSKQFHSCTEKVLPSLLAKLGEEGLPSELVFQALTKAVQLMAEHTRKEFSGPVWGPLLTYLKQLHSRWREREEGGVGEEGGEPLSRQLAHCLHLVGVMVAWRKGTRVASGGQAAQILLDILSEPELPAATLSVALHLGTSLLLVAPALPDLEEQPRLLEGIVSTACGRVRGKEVGLVLEFFQELVEGYENFQATILPACLGYCNMVAQSEENEAAVVSFLCRLCLHFEPRYSDRLEVNTAESVFVLSLESLVARPLKGRLRKSSPDCQIAAVLMKFVEAGLSAAGSIAAGNFAVIETLWAALVCLQYTRPLAESATHAIRQVYHSLKEALRSNFPLDPPAPPSPPAPSDPPAPPGPQISCSPPAPRGGLEVIAAQSLLTLVSAVGGEELLEAVPLEDVLEILRTHSDSVPLLSAVDSYFGKVSGSQPGSDVLGAEQLEKMLPLLQHNLSAPSSAVRLLSLRILCHFEQLSLPVQSQEGLDEDGAAALVDVLEICLHVEQIPTELNSYRDKLLWLQKLKYQPHSFNQLPPVYREVPLRYLLGMLYVNFSLVWEPVSEIISTYAVEENRQLFWGVFGEFLQMASEIAESTESCSSEAPPTSDDSSDAPWHSSLHVLFCLQSAQARWAGLGRPDHAHFRMRLWKCVGRFPSYAEPRSRILVPLLLRFLQSEYAPVEDQLTEFQDLRRRDTTEMDCGGTAGSDPRPETGTGLLEQEDEEGSGGFSTGESSHVASGNREGEEEGMEVVGVSERTAEDVPVDESRARSKVRSGRSHSGGRKRTRMLLAMLTTFSKFRNPKAFYKQEELQELYLKLLMHKDTEIQKLSLACLMSYKPPHLLPYRENLERLLDDVSFREELMNFSTDSECTVVAEEHREKLLPVLVRLLYGRMQRSTGHNTAKSGGSSRRLPVLRFLAGCQGNEMTEFVNLIMLPFQSLLAGSPGSQYVVDMSRVVPLRKQQGFLNMLGQLLSVLGPKAQPLLGNLFSVLLKVASGATQLLEERHLVQPYCVSTLKLLRQLAIKRISECFESYTEFDFTPFQEEVFHSAVWPQVARLPQECIQHPTPLMKLLLTWSKFPRYFSLLNQPIPDWVLLSLTDPAPLLHPPHAPSLASSSILYYVYGCLFSPGVSHGVTGVVMEMTSNFLNEEGQERKTEAEESGLSGYQLVVPFVPQLLRYLSSAIGGKCGRRAGPTTEVGGLQMEFSVLSKISVYVRDPAESSLLIQLLLPFLLNTTAAGKNWKYEESILHTVCNLVATVETVSGFYRILSQQFSVMAARRSRVILCNIFQEISQKDSQLQATASTVAKLNAWDPKRIDEPDYSTRLDGYSEAKQVLRCPEGWNIDQVLPILYNAMFFLLKSEDMSVRDAAASYVSDLISHVSEQDTESFQLLIMNTVVSGVKQGLRSNQEFARHESVSLLSHLVRTYPSHPRFSDMVSLTHKDPEADFFENIRHIQLHRRTRALRRLATSLAEGSLGPYSTTTFLLPLASQVVFTRLTNVEQNLVAEAINVIGAAAQQLKWSTYSFLLRHYLRQLPKRKDIQKTLIRAVVAILDAFHFDLTGAGPLDEGEAGVSKRGGPLPNGGMRSKSEGAVLGLSATDAVGTTETREAGTVSSEGLRVKEGKGNGEEEKEATGEGQRDEGEEEEVEVEGEGDKEGGEMEAQRQDGEEEVEGEGDKEGGEMEAQRQDEEEEVEGEGDKEGGEMEAQRQDEEVEVEGEGDKEGGEMEAQRQDGEEEVEGEGDKEGGEMEAQRQDEEVEVEGGDKEGGEMEAQRQDEEVEVEGEGDKEGGEMEAQRQDGEEEVEGEGDKEGGEMEAQHQDEEVEVEGEGDKEGGEMEAQRQQSTAQRIHRTIVGAILPSLQAVLTKKIDTPAHKLSRLSHSNEEAHILRVPVAMAVTKLLLALPESTLHRHLPSLLLKVCQTLKNRSRDVRDVARNTLVKMAAALGPKYLLYILQEMKGALTRGYQLHVLSYSLHTVLAGLVPDMKPGDLDPCLDIISQILMEDLFGLPAEEREVGEAVARIPESKTPQSHSSYEIAAQFLSPKLIPDLLAPVKQILESKCTSRVAHVVEEVFRRAGLGIHGNEAFTPQALLVLVHGLIRDNVPQLASKHGSKPKPSPAPAVLVLRPPDSRLLPQTPTRSGPKLSLQGDLAAHLVVQFGLQLLQAALKRGKFDETSEEQLRMLDPFVPLLAESLSSRHIKVLSRSLQCLILLIRMPLPSLNSQIQAISSHLFEVLKKYARAGAAVGSNRELVLSAFKAMTVIVRDFKQHEISEDELRLLLSFVEEDIYDYHRQSTAFPLLKTILGRKLIIPEVHELMQKVAQLSVTADSDNTRLQCRQALFHFIMNYPLGKKLLRYLDFIVTNLSYKEPSGRESVVELLATIFSKFPERLLHRHASYFFVPMASRLVNDESPTCRQMVAEAMKTLLKRLDTERQNDLATITEVWINNPKLIHKRLGVQVLGLMVETEGTGFEKRLVKFLPLLSKCLQLYKLMNSDEDADRTHSRDDDDDEEERKKNPVISEDDEMQVDAAGERTEAVEVATLHNQMESEGDLATEWKRPSLSDDDERDMDHLLFGTLSTLEKICNACTVLRVPMYSELMNELWERAQSLLLHPHSWVRLGTARLYGRLFAAYEPEEIVSGEGKKRRKKGKKARKEKKTVEYLLQDSVPKVQELSRAFCMQLSSPLLNAELANQAVKNLVFLAKVLRRLQIAGKISAAVTSSMDESTELDVETDVGCPAPRTDGDSEAATEQGRTEPPVKDLNWLIDRMSRLARYEAGHHPKESMKRTYVLQWTAAVSMDLGQEHLASYLPALFRPVYRELADTDKTAGEALQSMAQEIADMMKGVCGREAFSRAHAEVHQGVVLTREKRRKQAALEAVANPEKSIRRKLKKNLLKKESRKRKIVAYRPTAKKFRHH